MKGRVGVEDIDVINKFKRQISWGDDTKLIQHGDRTFMDSGLSIYIPVRWDHFRIQGLKDLGQSFSRRISALIYGDPPTESVHQIFWECSAAGIYTTWIDVDASIEWGGLITSAMEGIDWQRSFEAIAMEGMDAKPVFEWD